MSAVEPAVRVYWQPGCSSCLKTKEYLTSRHVAFESVNVLESPEALAELAGMGARGIPVVAREGRFVYAQSLGDVDRFLGLPESERIVLSPVELVDRLERVVEAGGRQARRARTLDLDLQMPNRPRSLRQLLHHVFRIAEVLVINATTHRLDMEMVVVEPPVDMTLDELIAYGDRTLSGLRSWWRDQRPTDFDVVIHTFYGDKPFHEVLERTTWHCAQHVRQLETILERNGIGLDRPLTQAELRGLPVPQDIWDE